MGTARESGPDYDLVIVGAGPVGLTIANLVGASGVRVLVLEQLESLIDYPRGVGMDDECLRVFQAIGLADEIVRHTTPHQWMEFRTARGSRLARIQPREDPFGWPRRNAFIQPLVDRVLLDGLARYLNVEVRFARTVVGFAEADGRVTVTACGPDGAETTVSAAYLVGCDGGRSPIRKALGIAFEGRTQSTQWLVVDLARDPVGIPNSILVCDPARPYVSIALPHGVRRLEFMVRPGESEAEVCSPEGLRRLLSCALPDPDSAQVIRSRVYTHNSRLAATFRAGRVLIAGDAAHLMPVWQGQGYNSGIRDANNLAWKLVAVLTGVSGDALLDTYTTERHRHAGAMIALSTLVGHIFSPTSRLLAAARDVAFSLLRLVPPARDYIVQMRFKPMPCYTEGVVVRPRGRPVHPAVGRLFVQPRVRLRDGRSVRLDDAIGNRFAIVAWGADPGVYMSEAARQVWRQIGGTTLVARAETELDCDPGFDPGTVLVGDPGMALKDWFATQGAAGVVLRPDRFIAAVCTPQTISDALEELGRLLHLRPEAGGRHCPTRIAAE